jgi:aldose 1-epimerase
MTDFLLADCYMNTRPDSRLLHVASGPWELEVEPARGGAITSLRHAGRDVLISPNPHTVDAMGAANFALVPYANRIAQGRFTHAGRDITLPRNFGDHAHPLHGTGWKRPWQVQEHAADSLTLGFEQHADEHWPWPFRATHRIALDSRAARFEISLRNLAQEAQPVGIGFHPAFAAHERTRLQMQVGGVWAIDADSLPTTLVSAGHVLPELPGDVPVLRATLVDHCFTGWSRAFRIRHAGSAGDIDAVEVTASSQMTFLQVYMPPEKPWFCAEPMSQMPDALHHAGGAIDTGLKMLAPDTEWRVWMQIAI